ncbi:MAG: glycosyltransferase family 4 protein [Nitrososphaerota archaeon]
MDQLVEAKSERNASDDAIVSYGKMSKIIIYTDAFWPNIGGGERYCLELAKTLTELGNKVTVVTPIKSKIRDVFNFKVIRLKKPIIFGFNLNFIEPFFKILREKPSVVHFSGPAVSDFFLIPIFKLLGYKTVLTFHGQFNSRAARSIVKIAIPLVYRFLDAIIVETRRDETYLVDARVPKERIFFMVYDGIDRNVFKCPIDGSDKTELNTERPLRFIFVGGITKSRPYKGYDILIDIFKTFNQEGIEPNPQLVVIGDGDLLPELKEKTRGYRNIFFLGSVDERELVEQLCKSDVLILPSKSDGEGFGKVALEAISCGKPVLVSKYAGISELVDRYKAGIVFDPEDLPKVVEQVKRLNSNRKILEELSKNGDEMIKNERLSLVESVMKTVEIYRKIR